MPVAAREVRLVQICYPQIYFACHTRHLRRRSTPTRLSAADSMLLAHLDERVSVRPTALSRHLGISPSTLSAAIKRLIAHGYIVQQRANGDGRVRNLRLSKAGAAAMQASSVLESSRVRAMLARLSKTERERALTGLSLLAAAARTSREEHQ